MDKAQKILVKQYGLSIHQEVFIENMNLFLLFQIYHQSLVLMGLSVVRS